MAEQRQLTAQELADLREMAETTTPKFGTHIEEVDHPERGKVFRISHNAEWEDHHPIARQIWERRGLKPKGK